MYTNEIILPSGFTNTNYHSLTCQPCIRGCVHMKKLFLFAANESSREKKLSPTVWMQRDVNKDAFTVLYEWLNFPSRRVVL